MISPLRPSLRSDRSIELCEITPGYPTVLALCCMLIQYWTAEFTLCIQHDFE